MTVATHRAAISVLGVYRLFPSVGLIPAPRLTVMVPRLPNCLVAILRAGEERRRSREGEPPCEPHGPREARTEPRPPKWLDSDRARDNWSDNKVSTGGLEAAKWGRDGNLNKDYTIGSNDCNGKLATVTLRCGTVVIHPWELSRHLGVNKPPKSRAGNHHPQNLPKAAGFRQA